eukprot:TRINITY_DN997_c0_g1_i1.p1 TRINITY_DN997_c0_g1~~TRINITY_DN997_c0_g1_i1.p1  ORF type:complete len:330 (+),score=64.61 TRINITY_DN997_c0_g1_i1:40-1029(+)
MGSRNALWFCTRMQARFLTITGKPPPVMLAHPLKENSSIAGWFVSEKLDGVRAFWWKNKLWTRNGAVLTVPKGFRSEMDAFFPGGKADGELFIKRDRFQQTISAVTKECKDGGEINWSTKDGDVKFYVFDIPPPTRGGKMVKIPASDRMQTLNQLLVNTISKRKPRYIEIVPTIRLPPDEERARSALSDLLKQTVSGRGEGLMVRHPDSVYVDGRSRDLLKVKETEDEEALVFDIALGIGKYDGLIGALRCMLMNGVTFECGVGLNDEQRAADPSEFVGKVITVKHQGITDKGVPRFPHFKGMRPDRDPEEFHEMGCIISTMIEEQDWS